jgi:hypothetical protein
MLSLVGSEMCIRDRASAAALGVPYALTKGYLNPTLQNFYERLNITEPLLNYMASPAEATQMFAASPQGLLGLAPQLPYRIDINGVGNPN